MSGAQVSIARLPQTGAALFGREEELRWLEARWSEGAHVVSVVAWGGVGKSALVNGWLRGMLRDGWRGAERVFGWSFYSQGTDRMTSADEFVGAALKWFGDADPTAGSPWDKGERLAELVRKQRALLVLDGVEPLQGGPGPEEGKIKDPALETLVRELAAQNRGMCLITTRIRVKDLDDLAGEKNKQLDLTHLSAEAGAQVLRALKVKGTDEELQKASEEYDGHSLALTLLGSYLEEACESDVRRRREIGPLERDERQGHKARRVMAAYELLFNDGPELEILKILGLFDRPASEEEIDVLRDLVTIRGEKKWYHFFSGTPERPLSRQEWARSIARLRRLRLLLEDSEENRDKTLDAHPLVREHFGEALRIAQPEAWREGHRRLYVYLRGKAKEFPETVEEMGPLYAAVVHGCRAGRNQEALDEVFWKRIQRGQEAFNSSKLGAFGAEVAVLSAFFDPPWERLVPGLTEPDQADILNDAGFALRALGRLPEAVELIRLAVHHAIARNDWKHAAIAAGNLSELFLTRGELGEALTFAQQSVELADKSGDAFIRMAKRTTLADVLHQRGRPAEAAALFEEAERLQKEMQPAYPRLYSLQGFQYCDMLLEQGQEAEVLARAARTLEWARADGDLLSIALDHLSLGRAHLRPAQRGAGADLPQAATHLDQAVEGLRRASVNEFLPRGLLARAELRLLTGDHPRAFADLDEALGIATRCGMRLHQTDAHLGYARLHLALPAPDPTQARAHLTEARALIETTGYHRRDPLLAQLDAMHINLLLDALVALLPAQLDTLVFKLGVPVHLLSSAQAPQATRCTEILHWAKQTNRLTEVEHLLFPPSAPTAPTSPTTTTATASPPAPPPPPPPTAAPQPSPPARAPASPTPPFPFPAPLVEAYKQDKLALLFGSGLSLAPDVQGSFPKWADLPTRLLDQVERHAALKPAQIAAQRTFFQDYLSLDVMLSALDPIKTALRGVRKYQAALNALFRPANAAPGEAHRALVALGVPLLATTNYDALLEAAEGRPARTDYTWAEADKALSDLGEGRKVLFKLHGTADREETVVMTQAEYTKAHGHDTYVRVLSQLLQQNTFLLLGYGMNDPLDLDLVLGLNAAAFGSAGRTHYALMKGASGPDRDRWLREFNVQVIDYQDHADLPAILRALGATRP